MMGSIHKIWGKIMKRVVPMVATAISTMSGHVVFVAEDSSVSVMLMNPPSYRNLVVPIPLSFPLESWVTNCTQEQKIEVDEFGHS
ncbi:unnamed protein product [marine sediment metagenome]|uniref:Uncharacterized protein n=1 Tax=marine sediment metagenome TaxID=412755 RepID=X0U0B6_9ZZZZ